ncbi:MAG: beta strand repeat-containing protein [Acidimicrobiales bacterium]
MTGIGLTATTQTETITGGTANGLAITSPAINATASSSATNAFTVTLEDSYGNPTTSNTAITVNLSATPSSGAEFAASSGGATVTSVTLPSGKSSVTADFGDTAPGSPSITVTGNGLASATQTETVSAGTANKLAITSPAISAATSSSATNAFTVTLEDSSGNPTTSGSRITVGLSSSSGGAKFAASSGGAAVSSVTLPAGQSSVTAYYGDSNTGTPRITASSTPLTSGTQTETILAATANKLVITSTAISATASSSATSAFTVTLETSSGSQTTSNSSTTINLSATPSSGAEFAGSSGGGAVTSVTLPARSSSVIAYFGDTVTGSPVITVAGTGLVSGAQTETITAGTANGLAVTFPSFNATASSSATNAFTVTLEDSYGNPTTSNTAITVNLSATPSSGAEFAAGSGGAATTSVTLPANTSSVTAYFGDVAPGSPVIAAASTGFTSGTQTETITAGTANSLAITSSSFNAAAASSATNAFTVTLDDSYGNPTTSNTAITVNLSATPSSGADFAASSGGAAVTSVTLPANTSSVTAYFGDVAPGSPVIAAASTGLTSGIQTETIAVGTANKFAITSTAINAAASSSATNAFTVTLEDSSSGNPTTSASPITLFLSATPSRGAEFAASSGGAATTSVTLLADTSSVNAYFSDTGAGNPVIAIGLNSKSAAASANWTSTVGVTGVTFAITEPGSEFPYTLYAVPNASASAGQLAGVGSASSTTSCGFATPGTGTYASTLCFVDFGENEEGPGFQYTNTNYVMTPNPANSPVTPPPTKSCQTMTAGITNTPYVLSFCLSETSSAGAVIPYPIPTYFDPQQSEAFLGNNGFYTGIPGDPALYQNTEGSLSYVYFTNIQLLDSNGNAATNWELVTGDAESTDTGEDLIWTSNQDLSLLPDSPTSPIGNACAGSSSPAGLTGVGTTTVECGASVSSDKTGTVMLEAPAPTTLTVTLNGAGLEAIFLGVLLP